MALGWDVLLRGDSYSGGRMRWGRAEIRGGVYTGVQLGGIRVAVELSWTLDPDLVSWKGLAWAAKRQAVHGL